MQCEAPVIAYKQVPSTGGVRGVNIVVQSRYSGGNNNTPPISDGLEEWRNFKFGTELWSLLLKGLHILYFNITGTTAREILSSVSVSGLITNL